MAFQIEKTFVVNAGREAVWALLTDPGRVARCLPGAAITEQLDERAYAGTITVKVGPVTASYKGKMRFERLDAAAGVAEISAAGQDVRGKGGADLRLRSQLTERAPGQTEVTTHSEVNVSGMLAQFGRGLIQDVSDQIFQKFTEAVRAELESAAPAAEPAPAAPINVVSVGATAAGRALGRTVRRPTFWLLVLVVALVVYWLWLR